MHSGRRSSSGRAKACRRIRDRGWCRLAGSRRSTACAGNRASIRSTKLAPRRTSPWRPAAWSDEESVEDDRLRLIFTCCHPALAADAQVALTLREVCGLTTEEIAQAFLAPAPTLAQRIVRAKAKIRDARIPYQVPARDELPERLDAVLRVIYLVFNEGYAASSGAAVTRHDLSGEAIRLGRLLVELLPEPEAIGLLALMLLHDSRRAARASPEGDLILLEDQDRSLWNRDADRRRRRAGASGRLRRGRSGAYAIQAAIAAVHAEAPQHRGDRLGGDRRAVRRAAAGRSVAGDRAESRGRGRHARRAGGRAGARRRDPRPRRAARLPPRARRPRRIVPAARDASLTPAPRSSARSR